MRTPTKVFEDHCEMDKGKEHYVRFVESGEHSWEAVDTAEWVLDPVPPPVPDVVVLPGGDTVPPGRYQGDEAEVQVQWAGFVALPDPVHGQADLPGRPSRRGQWLTSLDGIVSLLKSFKVNGSR